MAVIFTIPRSSLRLSFVSVFVALLYLSSSIDWFRDLHGEQSVVRLRGHKNAVTEVLFLNGTNALVSSSKDRLVKVWDLNTQHCIQVGDHSLKSLLKDFITAVDTHWFLKRSVEHRCEPVRDAPRGCMQR